jgi:AbrB family looped-hinge helix DNA binding protein
MTSGACRENAKPRLVRVQEKGQITLPADLCQRLGLKKGDLVPVTPTSERVLITPQELIATRALDRIGEILREQGLTLEELIESGREARGLLIEALYGFNPTNQCV